MKKIKINLDRPVMGKEQVTSRQNFKEIVTNFKLLKPPLVKNPWFYGTMGIASLAITFAIYKLNTKELVYEKTRTQTETTNSILNLPKDTDCIHPPIQDEEPSFSSFTIAPSKTTVIELDSGTKITIPKASLLINEDDSVEIKIREFNTRSDLFLSGIPMDYDQNHAFESAGMIEIRGFQYGVPVKIAETKSIHIELVLNKNPTGFDFWKLNESQSEWEKTPCNYLKNKPKDLLESLEKRKTIISSELVKATESIKNTKKPNRVAFQLPLAENQQFNLDYTKSEFPELEVFKELSFEVRENSGYDKSFTTKTWSNMDLSKKGGGYFVTFSSSKENITLPIRPVLIGEAKAIKEKEFDLMLKSYHEKIELLQREELKLRAQLIELETDYKKVLESLNNRTTNVSKTDPSSYIGSFSSDQFGVFNSDRPTLYPQPIPNEMLFTFDGSHVIQVSKIHLIDKTQDLRFEFGAQSIHSLNRFGYVKQNNLCCVVFDKEGNIGYTDLVNNSKDPTRKVKLTRLNVNKDDLSLFKKLIDVKLAES
jgi:hypothetical protein